MSELIKTPITVVRPKPEHLTAVLSFFEQISTPDFENLFHPHDFDRPHAESLCTYSGKDEYWLLFFEGRLAGYAMLRGWDAGYQDPSLGICVSPAFQKKGLSHLLMKKLLERARIRGSLRIILKVKRNNLPAIALYERYGFQLVPYDSDYLRGLLVLDKSPVSTGPESEVTILIATINEAENIRVLVPQLRTAFSSLGEKLDILVVDGHSTDDTIQVAKSLGCRCEIQKEPGYASAMTQGIRGAQGKYLIVMDGDGSHTAEDAFRLYENRGKADIIINSRYVKGGGSQGPTLRHFLSRMLNRIYALALDLPFQEISGGFRLYRTEILKEIELKSKFYEVQEELLILPYWRGSTAIEQPYVYRKREAGSSKTQLLRFGFRLLLAVIRFRQVKKEILTRKSNLAQKVQYPTKVQLVKEAHDGR